jgi:hypothetical protein
MHKRQVEISNDVDQIRETKRSMFDDMYKLIITLTFS